MSNLHAHLNLIDSTGLSGRFLAVKRGKPHPFIVLGTPESDEADAYAPVPRTISGEQLEIVVDRMKTALLDFYGALACADEKGTDEALAEANRSRYALELLMSQELAALGAVLPNVERLLSTAKFATLEKFAKCFASAGFGWGEYTRSVILSTAARAILKDVDVSFMVLAPAVGKVFRRVWDASPEDERRAFMSKVDLEAVIDEFGIDYADVQFAAA